jgi:hypothetical protein
VYPRRSAATYFTTFFNSLHGGKGEIPDLVYFLDKLFQALQNGDEAQKNSCITHVKTSIAIIVQQEVAADSAIPVDSVVWPTVQGDNDFVNREDIAREKTKEWTLKTNEFMKKFKQLTLADFTGGLMQLMEIDVKRPVQNLGRTAPDAADGSLSGSGMSGIVVASPPDAAEASPPDAGTPPPPSVAPPTPQQALDVFIESQESLLHVTMFRALLAEDGCSSLEELKRKIRLPASKWKFRKGIQRFKRTELRRALDEWAVPPVGPVPLDGSH